MSLFSAVTGNRLNNNPDDIDIFAGGDLFAEFAVAQYSSVFVEIVMQPGESPLSISLGSGNWAIEIDNLAWSYAADPNIRWARSARSTAEIAPAAVVEPAAGGLLALGVTGALIAGRRRGGRQSTGAVPQRD